MTAATVTVEHGSERFRWPARLDRIEAALDAATRTLNVVVRIDKPQARGTPLNGNGNSAAPPLLVGMYAQVDIDGREVGRYAMVPRRALRDGDLLWLLDDDGKVRLVPVHVLQEAADTVAVSADALLGTHVIVSDLKVVTEGMAVRVVDEPRSEQRDAPPSAPDAAPVGGRR